jgi:hypothetical protein
MIIGITGRAGSGKSTVGDILVKEHGFVCVNLADPLKRICRDVFGFTYEQLWGPSSARNTPDERYPYPWFLTPRHALQQLGTEWGRRCYENVWIDYALRVAHEILEEGREYYPTRGTTVELADTRASGVVIADVRFPNEAAAIRAKGGVLWRTHFGEGLSGGAGHHASERHVDELEVDVEIEPVPLSELPSIVTLLVR